MSACEQEHNGSSIPGTLMKGYTQKLVLALHPSHTHRLSFQHMLVRAQLGPHIATTNAAPKQLVGDG